MLAICRRHPSLRRACCLLEDLDRGRGAGAAELGSWPAAWPATGSAGWALAFTILEFRTIQVKADMLCRRVRASCPRRCACICKTIRSSERRGFIHRREAEVGQSERDALCHPYSLQTPNPAPQSGGLHLRATSNKTPPAALFAVKRRPEPSLIPSSPSLPIRAF